MKLSLRYQPAASASASPYRLVDDQEQEIAWANDFLDIQRIRQLSFVRCAPMDMTCCTSLVGGCKSLRET